MSIIIPILAATMLGLCCPALLPELMPEPWAFQLAVATPPVVEPEIVEPAPAAAPDPVVDLLDTLERSARDLNAFTASIRFQTEDKLLKSRTMQMGTILYQVVRTADGQEDKRFAIVFEWTADNGRKKERREHFIFREGWFVEIDHEAKKFVKRQVVRPDQEFDPLKLGEGPIPIPIGQPKDEVLGRFDVTLIDLPDDGPLAKLRGAGVFDGLRLVPKPGTRQAEDYRHIDLFYDRETHLPAGVNVIEFNGNRKTACLTDLVRNPPARPEWDALLDIRPPKGDWAIDIRPLKR